MNKYIKFLSLIVLFTLTFSSCKKEEPLRPDNTHYIEDGTYTVEGITWVLVDAKIYRDNLDNNDQEVFDHFGGSRFESSMALYSVSPVIMDSIKQNVTTWVFNNDVFTWNGTNQYEYTVYDNRVWTPIGLENGSARPIEIKQIDDVSMTVSVHEAYESDGTYNYKYWTELTFVKSGESCNNCVPDTKYGYVYSGIWETPVNSSTTMEGTTWVVTRYNNGLSGNVYPNDTLDFISQTFYTINGSGNRSYSLSNVIGNNNKSLSLYSFSTLGGDYSGLNNSQMTDMFDVNNTVTVWMERIQ
jgi:hypothetical protein